MASSNDFFLPMFLANGQKQQLGRLFQGFMQRESSGENGLFYGALLTFAGRKSWLVPSIPGGAHEQALWIYQMFLVRSAPQEVNVRRADIQEVERVLFPKAQGGRRGAVHVPRGLFERFDQTARMNLSDPWSRFIGTKDYADFTRWQALVGFKRPW